MQIRQVLYRIVPFVAVFGMVFFVATSEVGGQFRRPGAVRTAAPAPRNIQPGPRTAAPIGRQAPRRVQPWRKQRMSTQAPTALPGGPPPPTIATADDGPFNVSAGHMSLLEVGGKPAIAYHLQSRMYLALASSSDGTGEWTKVEIAHSTIGNASSGIIVDGRPAVAYGHNSYCGGYGDCLRFSIGNADGTDGWEHFGIAGRYPDTASMTVVAGRPAIAWIPRCYNCGQERSVLYAIANAPGSYDAWTTVTIDADARQTFKLSLAIVAGKPAISYRGPDGLMLATASTTDGTGDWSTTPVHQDVNQTAGLHSALIDLGGQPAIALQSYPFALYRRSADGSWTSATLHQRSGQSPVITVFGGKPVVAASQGGSGGYELVLLRASTSDGTGSWGTQVIGPGSDGMSYLSIGTVAGRIGIAFVDKAAEALRYASLVR